MTPLDIGTVAEKSGIPASTLRYYEEIGLIASIGRHGLRRQFGPEVLVQLVLIRMGQAAGFSLQDIAGMFGPDGRPEIPRDEIAKRAEALDRHIRDMIALRDTLRHVADCPAPSHMDCPSFQHLIRQEAARAPRRARKRPR